MKKTILSLLAVLALSVTGYSQIVNTNTSPPSLGGAFDSIWQILTTGTNWVAAPHWLYNVETKQSGAGLAMLCYVSPYVLTGVGLDWFDPDNVWMPSAQLELRTPTLILGKVKATPFGYTGIATSLNDGDNWNPVAIIGAGLEIKLAKGIGLFGAYEYRTEYGDFIRAGVDIKF